MHLKRTLGSSVNPPIVLKCVAHVQHDYFSLFNQSDRCFLASSLPFPSSLLKLPNSYLHARPPVNNLVIQEIKKMLL